MIVYRSIEQAQREADRRSTKHQYPYVVIAATHRGYHVVAKGSPGSSKALYETVAP